MEPTELFEGEEMARNNVIEECSKYNTTFHNHTDASLGDGTTRPDELAKRAKEIGATMIGITDHGNCANWMDFYNAARKEGIKPALGVEAYIKNEDGRYNHLILLAKNYEGFKDISRFVSETNRHIEKMGNGKEIPVATEDTLDLAATGNVICTSACIAGPVADPFMDRQRRNHAIEKIRRQIDRLEMPAGYDEAVGKQRSINAEIEDVKDRLKNARETSKPKSFKALEREIKKSGNEERIAQELAQLNVDRRNAEEAAEQAKKLIPELEKRRDELKDSLKEKDPDTGMSINETVSKGRDKEKRLRELQSQMKEIDSGRISVEEARRQATEIAERYKERFGDDFYMEIQNHGIPIESYVYPEEAQIAKKLGIPLIAANDAHVPTKDKVQVRTDMQNANYITTTKAYKEASVGDSELYIKSGSELAEALLKIFTPEQVIEAMKNTAEIEKQIDIEIPEHQKHYPSFPDAKNLLRQRCEKGIKERYPDGFPDEKEYRDRLEYELSVIDKMGFNDYFCEVFDFIDFAKSHSDNSIEIGPARGSAAGSLVAYLCGITELDDPIKMGLMFERFLNPERVSMPDIDTDFSKHARDITIEYVKHKYGERAVANIMTKAKMGAKMALDYAGKLYGLRGCGDKRKFVSLSEKIKKALDAAKMTALNTPEAEELINDQFGNNQDALAIVDKAKNLEGLTTSFGTHAAGVIIVGNGEKVEDLIPLISITDRNGNQGFAIQADMIQAEAQLGFIKMDFLGLKNLNVITKAMHLITEDTGEKLDPYRLPVEEKVIEDIFQKGDTNFVFQFESDGMKKMLSQLRPKSFADLVLAVAVYRPGPMDFIPSIINSKNTGKPSDIVEKIPILKDALAETYGYPVYQEQVMKIMTQCAGFTLGEADNVRRAMSKKHVEDLEAARPKFVQGSLEKNGIPVKDSNWLFEKLMPFAKYGFNKAHAASYSMVSYMTAYLKEHYFKEYVCAAMTEQGDKVPQLIEDCKRHGVGIELPDVNRSDTDFRPDDGNIIFGLSNIKQVKGMAQRIVDEREKNGEYTSVQDFVRRINPDSGAMEALAKSGALRSLCPDRKKALDLATKYKEAYSGYDKKKEALEKARDAYNAELESGRSDEKRLKALNNTLIKAQSAFDIADDVVKMTRANKRLVSRHKDDLKGEFEYLGAWVSGSPLEDYSLKGYETTSAGPGHHTIAGVVTDFKLFHTKKDGREMCGFKLVDKDSNSIRCTVFPDQYTMVKGMLKNDAVVALQGNIEIKEDSREDGNVPPRKEMVVRAAEPLSEKEEVMIVTTYDEEERAYKLTPLLAENRDGEKGLRCTVFEEMTQEYMPWEQKVSRIFPEKWDRAKVIRMEPDGTAYIGNQEIDTGLGPDREEPEYGIEEGDYNPYDRDNAEKEIPYIDPDTEDRAG